MSLMNTFAAWGVSQTLAAQVSAILRKYGADAHVYLPGIGVINGFAAGNYLDSAGTTPATVDNPVGLVVDTNGTINATQATTANKPILRLAAGKYSWQFDGTDFLSLGSVPFQMGDDHFVISAASSSDISANRHIYNTCNGTIDAGRIANLAINSSGAPVATWRDDALTLAQVIHAGTYSSNTKWVIAAEKQGNNKKLFVNGAQSGSTNTTALGATTVTVGVIGALVNNGSSGMIGSIYPLIAIKGVVTDADKLILAKFIGLQAGVTI